MLGRMHWFGFTKSGLLVGLPGLGLGAERLVHHKQSGGEPCQVTRGPHPHGLLPVLTVLKVLSELAPNPMA